MHLMMHDGADTAMFIRLLDGTSTRFGPVLMFPDNASWHKATPVRNYVSECDDILLECLVACACAKPD